MITIFTLCAPFEGHYDLIQRNALKSWLKLDPQPEIFIMGDKEKGIKEVAEELNLKVIPVKYVSYPKDIGLPPIPPIPSIKSMFEEAQKNAKNDILCFSNCDILHYQCLINGVKFIQNQNYDKYLATGRRYDIDIDYEITDEHLINPDILKSQAMIHGPGANDYFIFPKHMDFSNMPDFDAVRPGWDTWLAIDTLDKKIPLIDATDIITIIHQNHKRQWENPEIKEYQNYNIQLAGKRYWAGLWKGITEGATVILKRPKISDKIKKTRDFLRDIWAYQDIRNMIKDDKPTIIDGGACVGDTVDIFKQAWPQSTIYAFEPITGQEREGASLFNLKGGGHLAKTFSNIHIEQIALGDKDGETEIYLTGPPENSSLLKPFKHRILKKIKIKMRTLDSWAEEKNIEKIDIVKLDLQGYEYQALRGMKKFLMSTIKAVYVEIQFEPAYENQSTFYEIGDFLRKFNFELFQIYEPSYKQLNALFIRDI